MLAPSCATPNTGRRCQCGVYHYTCSTCGADCTVGTPAGPATQAIDGKHRCAACNRAWQQYLGSATPTTEAEVRVIRAGLTLLKAICDCGAIEPSPGGLAALDKLLAAIPAAPPSALAGGGGSIDS